ncbi:MAG: hypothetical protein ACYTG0_28195 [Planctomycetota bacterium]|jgi:hypothetical protein
MSGERDVAGWEYSRLGPANSLRALAAELEAKEKEGWELTGVRSDSSQVYAVLRRRAGGSPDPGRKAA